MKTNRSKKLSYVRRRLRAAASFLSYASSCPLPLDFNLRKKKTRTNKKLCTHSIDILLVKKKIYLTELQRKWGRGKKLYTKPEHLKVCPSEGVVAGKKNLWSLPSRRGGRGTQFPPRFSIPPRLQSEISNLGFFSRLSIECTHTRTLPQPVATCANFLPQCNYSPSPAPPLKKPSERRHMGKREREERKTENTALLRFKFWVP